MSRHTLDPESLAVASFEPQPEPAEPGQPLFSFGSTYHPVSSCVDLCMPMD